MCASEAKRLGPTVGLASTRDEIINAYAKKIRAKKEVIVVFNVSHSLVATIRARLSGKKTIIRVDGMSRNWDTARNHSCMMSFNSAPFLRLTGKIGNVWLRSTVVNASCNWRVYAMACVANGFSWQSSYSRSKASWFLRRKECIVVRNRAGQAFSDCSEKVLREKEKDCNSEGVAACIVASSFRPHKRLRAAMKWAENERTITRLYVCGDAKGVEGTEKVVMQGCLGEADLIEVYAKCKVIVHPCWNDACPNAVIEAMKLGCIPIVSEESGIKEILPAKLGFLAFKEDDAGAKRPAYDEHAMNIGIDKKVGGVYMRIRGLGEASLREWYSFCRSI